ncbi:MAG: hypothetical protein SGPRY_001343, partial [Prymnesium sp.]
LLQARERQRQFESRVVSKPVYSASLLGQSKLLAHASPTVAFLPREGMAVLGSTAELLQFSLHLTPLPHLALSPLDGSVHLLETGAGESVHQIWPHPAAPPPITPSPFPNPRRPTPTSLSSRLGFSFLCAGEESLLLSTFDDDGMILVHSLSSGSRVASLGGHVEAAPMLRALPSLSLIASSGQCRADASIRLWRILRLLTSLAIQGSTPAPGFNQVENAVDADRLDISCERVLIGHTMAITDLIFLPEMRHAIPFHPLMVSSSLDCSIRFWDVDATPHLLTAPEGGNHVSIVRVGPALYAPLHAEWTTSNEPFVNCLTLLTKDTPLTLTPLSEWYGPGELSPSLPPRLHLGKPSQSGMVNLWGVARTLLNVEACRFDEPLAAEHFSAIESLAAKDWRGALTRVQQRDTGFSQLIEAERRQRAQVFSRVSELLAHASLSRPSLSSGMEEEGIKEIFALALVAARTPHSLLHQTDSDGEWRHRELSKLTLTQCFNFCRSHALLCAPVDSLARLRGWYDTLRDFTPSLASREKDGRRVKGSGACVDQFIFSRLLNDLDPIARRAPPRSLGKLRDLAFGISTRASSLRRKLLFPRGGDRLALEMRLDTWLRAAGEAVRGISAVKAHVRAHAAGFESRRLLIFPRSSAHNSVIETSCLTPRLIHSRHPAQRSLGEGARVGQRVARPSKLAPRPPAIDLDRSREVREAAETPRRVYLATELAGGTEVAVAVIPQGALAQTGRGRALMDHLQLEATMARALADHCSFFSRSLGLLESPPSLRQREHEAHLVWEITPSLRSLPEVLSTHGRLTSLPQLRVLSLWGRQLLLALEAAHGLGVVLRTLRLSHVRHW